MIQWLLMHQWCRTKFSVNPVIHQIANFYCTVDHDISLKYWMSAKLSVKIWDTSNAIFNQSAQHFSEGSRHVEERFRLGVAVGLLVVMQTIGGTMSGQRSKARTCLPIPEHATELSIFKRVLIWTVVEEGKKTQDGNKGTKKETNFHILFLVVVSTSNINHCPCSKHTVNPRRFKWFLKNAYISTQVNYKTTTKGERYGKWHLCNNLTFRGTAVLFQCLFGTAQSSKLEICHTIKLLEMRKCLLYTPILQTNAFHLTCALFHTVKWYYTENPLQMHNFPS